MSKSLPMQMERKGHVPMRRLVVLVVLCFVAGGLLAYSVYGRPTLSARAMAAYKAGDYAKALPLFKEWAARPEVWNNLDQRQRVMAYVLDIQLRMNPQMGSAGATGTQPSVNVSAKKSDAAAGGSGGDEQANLMAQAMAFALEQKKGPGDPPMGADRIPHQPIKAGEVREMAIKELGNFEYEQEAGGDVPADVKALDGGHVRLNGFMIPLTQADKLTDFALVPSLVSCCFGQPPGVQHVVSCHTPANKGVEFSMDEIVVEGVIRVKVVREQGYTNSIFEMEVTSVKPKG